MTIDEDKESSSKSDETGESIDERKKDEPPEPSDSKPESPRAFIQRRMAELRAEESDQEDKD